MASQVRLWPENELANVGTIYCIGRNYVLHAKELGNPVPDVPVVFTKPGSALIGDGGEIILPSISDDVHFETELVLRIGERAIAGVRGVAIGLDMTLRDVQSRAKEEGKPWTVAKGWRTSAPLGPILPVDRFGSLDDLSFQLEVNGEVRQQGRSANMLFSMGALLSYLSSIFLLEEGDLLFTGTPEGVGRVSPGDRLSARILGAEESALNVRVRAE